MSERRTHTETIFPIAVAFVLFASISWSYVGFRTWGETVGFDPRVSTRSFLIATVFVSLYLGWLVGVVYLLLRWRAQRRGRTLRLPSWRIVAPVFVMIAVFASAAGEAWVLLDEARFREEVGAHAFLSDDEVYARERSWPSGNCALLYSPAKGYWATE